MCLAIPSRVERVDGLTALVEVQGQRREVSLMLLDEDVGVGDWLLVRNGAFAFERLDASQAQAVLALIDAALDPQCDTDLRSW